MIQPKNYSRETYLVLRNCALLDEGEYEGKRFVRCIPRALEFGELGWGLAEKEAREQAHRVVKEINEPGVIVSWHNSFGDYVRVETKTETFRLICHMQS